jgi:hypothetical protein
MNWKKAMYRQPNWTRLEMNGQTAKARKPGFLRRIAGWFRKPVKKKQKIRGERYLPEKHYMRGPGPKARAKEHLETIRAEPLSQ